MQKAFYPRKMNVFWLCGHLTPCYAVYRTNPMVDENIIGILKLIDHSNCKYRHVPRTNLKAVYVSGSNSQATKSTFLSHHERNIIPVKGEWTNGQNYVQKRITILPIDLSIMMFYFLKRLLKAALLTPIQVSF